MTTILRERILTDLPAALEAYEKQPVIAMDTETSGLDRHADDVMVVALAAPGVPPAVLHVAGRLDPALIDLLNRKVLLGHNMTSFDVPFLAKYGYDPLNSVGWVDTMITEQLCLVQGRRDIRFNLKDTAKRRAGKILDKSIDHAGWANVELTDDQLAYAAGDVATLHAIHKAQMVKIEDLKLQDAFKTEMAAQRATAMMSINGMPVVLDDVEGHIKHAKDDMTWLSAKLEQMAGYPFNPTSSKQVKGVFKDLHGLVLPSTDVETLANVRDMSTGEVSELADLIMKHRKLKKSAMYDGDWTAKYVSSDGRVRSSYWQMGTDTGRFSCSDPNLQQWPKDLRGLLGYKEGSDRLILSVDYSQIEILIASMICQEPKLTEAVIGSDVHTYVASLVFGIPPDEVDKRHRSMAKAASFTLLFAGGSPGIIRSAKTSGEPINVMDAERVQLGFFEAFPRVHQYIEGIKRRVAAKQNLRSALSVRVPFGPVRSMFGASLTPSTVVNTLVQGTAAVGLKRSLARICEAGLGQHICAVVHDEIVLDVPRTRAEEIRLAVEECMKAGMEDIIGIRPKLESTYGPRWGGMAEATRTGFYLERKPS